MDNDDDDGLRELFAVIGATAMTAADARSLLERHHGSVPMALADYYDNLGGVVVPQGPPMAEAMIPPPSSSASTTSSSSKSKQKQSNAGDGRRIATLASLSHQDDSDDSGDEGDHGQEFYAGGEKSGIAVRGPPKKAPKKFNELVEGIIQQGERAAEEEQRMGRPPPAAGSSAAAAAPAPAFRGTGYRLSDERTPSEVITNLPPAGAKPGSGRREGGQEEEETTRYVLTFWKNGFSVDEGPLRDLEAPANVKFLQELNMGFVPSELGARPGERVDIAIRQMHQQDYVPPKVKPFGGQGNRLGSPDLPRDVAQSAPVQPSTAATSATATVTATATASTTPPTTAPVSNASSSPDPTMTTLQIRLADGTRLVAKFSLSQTIGDIHTFVNNATPNNGRPFVIMTTFPNRELSDLSATLEQANLRNAVVVQKFLQ